MTIVLSGCETSVLTAAVESATPGLWNVWAGRIRHVSEPMSLPDQVMVLIDTGSISQSDRRAVVSTFADLLVAHLGPDQLVVDVPRHQPWPFDSWLSEHGCVQAWAFGLAAANTPSRQHRHPPAWLLDGAVRWLASVEPAGHQGPTVRIVDRAFELSWADAEQVLPVLAPHQQLVTYAHDPRPDWVDVAPDLQNLTNPPAIVATGMTGPVWEVRQCSSPRTDDLVDVMVEQRERLTSIAAAVDWAGVYARPTTRDVDTAVSTPERVDLLPDDHPISQQTRRQPRRWPHGATSGFSNQLIDVSIPEVMWWQLLGPGHVDRLGGVPDIARAVAEDRWEITFGEAADWIPGSNFDEDVVRRAYRTLAPLLLSAEEGHDVIRQRRGPSTPTPPGTPT